MKKCSVCKELATKEIQVFWQNNQEEFIPRCDNHVVKGYKGIVRKLKRVGRK